MLSYMQAINDFREARRKANLQALWARLNRQSKELLSYEEVQKALRLTGGVPRGLQDIPIDHIIGSVGRYRDFSRDFLPLTDTDEERWARVELAMNTMAGVPPIDVYKVGEVYFVRDGHHRVSVAKQMGADTIQAYVTEIPTDFVLTPETDIRDLIIQAELRDFLKHTGLDKSRPQADLRVSEPGRYEVLLHHIEVHRYFMGLEQQREISMEEAAAHWYDTVYLPVWELIQRRSILKDHPNRTPLDLYLWVAENHARLKEELGWEVDLPAVAAGLAAASEADLTSAPPGEWRRLIGRAEPTEVLFQEIMVALNGEGAGWEALRAALAIAQREQGRVYGLHVVPPGTDVTTSERQAVRETFERLCVEAGVTGYFAFDMGEVPRQVCLRSRWMDLVVLSVSYPPGAQILERLRSGFRTIVQNCARPILAVPHAAEPCRRALVAYDDSPNAREALFIAAYMALRWSCSLVIASVAAEKAVAEQRVQQADAYLRQYGLEAQLRTYTGAVTPALLETLHSEGCDMMLMGSYGGPIRELFLGSTVDEALRSSPVPVLICR